MFIIPRTRIFSTAHIQNKSTNIFKTNGSIRNHKSVVKWIISVHIQFKSTNILKTNGYISNHKNVTKRITS